MVAQNLLKMLDPLLDKYKIYFEGQKPHVIKGTLLMVCLILDCETVNLKDLSKKVPRYLDNYDAKEESHYQRLIRYFEDNQDSKLWECILSVAVSLFRHKINYLTLDGTSWEHGEQKYHFMTLGMVYQGITIPIYWIDLSKKGISSIEERKKLINEAIVHYNLKRKILLADREYIGEDWFLFLKKKGIDFVIRCKKGNYRAAIDQAEGDSYTRMKKRALKRKPGGNGVSKQIQFQGHTFTFVMVKNISKTPDDELIYLISTVNKKAKICKAYRIRWSIERCFFNLKSNGFNLESINLKSDGKINLMMALVVLAYAICVFDGIKKKKFIKMKFYKKNNSTYKESSFFGKGIRNINNMVRDFGFFIDSLFQMLKPKKRPNISHNSIHV